jgi:hypothetical protein
LREPRSFLERAISTSSFPRNGFVRARGSSRGWARTFALRVYPGMDHIVNDDEISAATEMLGNAVSGKEAGNWAK